MGTGQCRPHRSCIMDLWDHWCGGFKSYIIFILQVDFGPLPVEVMTCLTHALQISAKTKRKPPDSSDNIVHRPIPPWLLNNAEFQRVADECFDLWFANRDSGLAGLSSFVGTMYDCATKFLSTHVIVATTARQRLELALTAMRLLERHPIDERRLSRLCAADCDLSAIIELHVDSDVFWQYLCASPRTWASGWTSSGASGSCPRRTPARPDILSDPAEGFRGHRQHVSTLQSLKRLKQGTPLAVTELWDDHDGILIDDTARMAKLIQDAAQDRQGRVTSYPLHGQNLLDQWYANFSQCHTRAERHEIANLILDRPNVKKSGPDGLKRYCHQLAIIFQEAWNELASGQASIDYVRSAQVSRNGVPKVEGANTIDKLRDLELGNEVRKVLARMLFKVLDEVCQHESHGLCHAQQASWQDVTSSATRLCCVAIFGLLTKRLSRVMIPTCSSPLIAVKVTIEWVTAAFRDVFVRHEHRLKFWPLLNAFWSICRCSFWTVLNLRLFIWHLVWHRVAQLPACFTSLLLTHCCLLCNRLLVFQVFLVSLMIGPWVAMACLRSLQFPIDTQLWTGIGATNQSWKICTHPSQTIVWCWTGFLSRSMEQWYPHFISWTCAWCFHRNTCIHSRSILQRCPQIWYGTLYFWSCQNIFVSCYACARGEHFHVYTFLVSKSPFLHAACFVARGWA